MEGRRRTSGELVSSHLTACDGQLVCSFNTTFPTLQASPCDKREKEIMNHEMSSKSQVGRACVYCWTST